MTKVKLKIDGMHCTSCALTIDMDLEDLEGVKSSKTSYAKLETEVDYDEGKIKPDDILKQVQQTGYTALVKPNT